MNDRQQHGSWMQHPHHTLRPVAIAVVTAIGVSGLLVGCGGGGGGHHGGGGGGGGGGGTSLSLSSSGGDGGTATGVGGDGGNVILSAMADNTVIDVLTSNSGAPDTSTIPASDTGANPLEINADTTIPVDPADPGTVAYFQKGGDCQIYQSQGTTDPGDDTTVTGVEIAAGATLMLQSNQGATGCIQVADDIVNDGAIATETQGGSVALYASTYFGGGPINTSGACGTGLTPDAGAIGIYASTAIYNKGNLTAAGADCDTAGAGGNIDLYVMPQPLVATAVQAAAATPTTNNLWNAGALDASGGTSTTGAGGDGGDTSLYLAVTDSAGGGSLISAGTIDTSGGDGFNGGGAGGGLYVDLVGPAAADGVASSNIYILGGTDTHGGSVTDPDGDGGDAGDVSMTIEAGGGSLELLGFSDIEASGGDGAGGGGSGGLYVGLVSCAFDAGLNPTACFSANITNQASIDASGGNALVAGDGGNGGNIGAVIGLYEFSASGDINNSGNLTTNGGAGAGNGTGGDGGGVELYTSDGNTTNSGTVSAHGGNGGDTGGSGSFYVFLGGAQVTNSGNINASGGNANLDGGDGGYVELDSYGDGANSVNTGTVTVAGGTGSNSNGSSGAFYIDGQLQP